LDDETYSFALENTLSEIQSICPDVKNCFMFREDGETIARTENTPEKVVINFINSFDGILEKAEAIGGVEEITLEATKGRTTISSMKDLYIVTVTTEDADWDYINTLTHVLIPTILKLLEKINPTSLKSRKSSPEIEPEIPKIEKPADEYAEEEKEEEDIQIEKLFPEALKETKDNEQNFSELSVSQLIVEDLGGLLVPSDTVRIDNEILSKWAESCENSKIEEVIVETFDGKATTSKIKPIKDSKYEGKGVIRMPEKIQLKLDIRKGELVRVKPIID